jgi:hypothetical protein
MQAFMRFCVSSVLGALLTSIFFPAGNLWISIIFIALYVLSLFIIRVTTVKSFKSLNLLKVSITDKYIEKEYDGITEKILLSDIVKLNIVRSSRGSIREIKIVQLNKKILILNGLENLEQLYTETKVKCRKEVVIKESKEPIDYDHPMFYVIFGFFFGFFISFLIHFITFLEVSEIRIIFILFALNNLILSIYFIINKPISKRYGDKTKVIDFVLGILMSATGIGMFLI